MSSIRNLEWLYIHSSHSVHAYARARWTSPGHKFFSFLKIVAARILNWQTWKTFSCFVVANWHSYASLISVKSLVRQECSRSRLFVVLGPYLKYLMIQQISSCWIEQHWIWCHLILTHGYVGSGTLKEKHYWHFLPSATIFIHFRGCVALAWNEEFEAT